MASASILIETIDLASPPPFVRVVKDPTQLAEVTTCEDPAISAWLYTPDWGDVESIFSDGQRAYNDNIACRFSQSGGLLPSFMGSNRKKVGAILKDEMAESFLDRCVELEKLFLQNLMGMNKVTSFMNFQNSYTTGSDLHVDVNQVRALTALDPDNTIIAHNGHGEIDRRKSLPLDIAHKQGYRLYNTPLKTILFLRGSLLNLSLNKQLGHATSHARPPTPDIACGSRATMLMNFTRN